jgi:uncharacterized protein (DUF1015 family)
MAEIAPFRGILYKPSGTDLSALIAPPYDVIYDDERRALAALSPHNIVRLILPEGDGDQRYAAAAQTLGQWMQQGVMARDATPAIYRYHQEFSPPGGNVGEKITRRGFIARLRLHRFDEGVVLPHERTLAGPKADRLKLKRATRTHLSQVFGLFHDDSGQVEQAFAAIEAEAPALSGRTADGVIHRLFRLTDPVAQAAVMTALRDKRIYIADGHHRYETMLALREEMRREPGYIGLHSSVEYGTIFLCNAKEPGLLVFPTHRLVFGLPHFDFADLLRRAAPCFVIEERAAPTPAEAAAIKDQLAQRGTVGPSFLLCAGSKAAYLTLRKDADVGAKGPKVLRDLDVTVLHTQVFENLLGIDRSAQEAQTHLRYSKDTAQAIAAASDPAVQLVALMNPTKVSQVMDVSDAGQIMPQKSTYFYPKLASGLVLNPLDPTEPVDTIGKQAV